MSNEDLRSQLSQIRSEISRVERENQQIRSELGALAASASANSANLIGTSNNARNAMENSRNTINYSNEQLKKTFNVQLQIKEMYFIFKDVETANKKIRMLNNKLYFDYKNQAMVRKIVRAFVDNLELNLVSDERIYKALEKEFLQAPDYWLAYVLLSIMYWKNDNKKKADQCLEEALKRNSKSTAIFFMLFYLKLSRVDVALDWFYYYKELDKTGSDSNTFLMFVSSLPNRIHDKEFKTKVGEVFAEYIEEEVAQCKEETDTNGIISIIYNYFVQIGQSQSLKYPKLSQYIVEKQVLASVLSKAKNNQKILSFMEELNKVHLNERNIYLSKYIDELISIPSEAEQKIIDEIHYNEEIIATMEPLKKLDDNTIFKSNDFRKLAKDNFERKITHDESKLNVINEIINWVYVNKNNEINSLTRWNLFSLTRPYTKEAYIAYKNSYQNSYPRILHISSNDFQISTSFNNLQYDLKQKDTFIENKKERLLKTVRNGGPITSICFGGVFLIASIVLFVLSLAMVSDNGGPSVGTIFKIIAFPVLAVGIFLLVSGLVRLLIKNPKRRNAIKENMEKESARLDEIIREMYKEMASYRVEYQEADKISQYINERIEQM